MSLRMNLYGWSLRSFEEVLGSNDLVVLERSTKRITDALKDDGVRFRANAWCRTLIKEGAPLRHHREPPAIPTDGSLLVLSAETETHTTVVHCITRAIARQEHLDLAGKSSFYAHPAVGELYRDLSCCGFARSKGYNIKLTSWLLKLSEGTPLFGDMFRTEWSFYSVFKNDELVEMIPVLQAAIDFTRPIPQGVPQEMSSKMATGLSEGSNEFARDLVRWFTEIQRAEQDAFILWW